MTSFGLKIIHDRLKIIPLGSICYKRLLCLIGNYCFKNGGLIFVTIQQ